MHKLKHSQNKVKKNVERNWKAVPKPHHQNNL